MRDDASAPRDLSEAEIESVSGGIIIVGGLEDHSWVTIQPQPLPPGLLKLNPQPEPPGLVLIGPQPQPG
jgi:hypothetical protein